MGGWWWLHFGQIFVLHRQHQTVVVPGVSGSGFDLASTGVVVGERSVQNQTAKAGDGSFLLPVSFPDGDDLTDFEA